MAKKRKLEASPAADRSELLRLLEAAKADHHDDGPRLALADWLEENGGESDRARAEVIRLQLDTDAGGSDWTLRVEELSRKWMPEWLGPHRDFFRPRLPTFERGLMAASTGAAAWPTEGPSDEAWAWVEEAMPGAMKGRLLPALLASSRMATVPRFWLGRWALPTASELTAAFSQMPGGPVRALRVTSRSGAEESAARHLKPGLEELELISSGGEGEWPGLFLHDGVEGLRSLTVSAAGLGPAEADALSRLHDLRRFAAGGDLLESLSAPARLPLRRLALGGGLFGLDALADLENGPCRDTLEELHLGQLQGAGGFPVGLALPRLRRLTLLQCALDSTGAANLAPLMARLDELNLSGSPAGEGCGAACLFSTDAPGPRVLRVASCGLGDEGLTRLAAWPGLARVRVLEVGRNQITGAGLRALAGSAHTSSLEALSLEGSARLEDADCAALVRSPLAGRLTWLSLSGAEVGASTVKTFLAVGARSLRELRTTLGTGAISRLRAAMPGCAIGWHHGEEAHTKGLRLRQ